MTNVPTDHHADDDQPLRYPTNHVVGVVDTIQQVNALVPDLLAAGFTDADVHVHSGVASADALDDSTGRSGMASLAIRIAETLGIENIEMERKERYEQAMREGKYVVLVAAPEEDHKDRATAILDKHAAHTVSFHGRFTIEGLIPPKEA